MATGFGWDSARVTVPHSAQPRVWWSQSTACTLEAAAKGGWGPAECKCSVVCLACDTMNPVQHSTAQRSAAQHAAPACAAQPHWVVGSARHVASRACSAQEELTAWPVCRRFTGPLHSAPHLVSLSCRSQGPASGRAMPCLCVCVTAQSVSEQAPQAPEASAHCKTARLPAMRAVHCCMQLRRML